MCWFALHGTRAQLNVLLAGVVVFWSAPVVLVGGAAYPVTQLRNAALFLAVAALLGLTVQRLVGTLSAQARNLSRVAAAARSISAGPGALAASEPGRACVAMLDLDHFKRFNDARGHLAGDHLLEEVAAAWRRQMRPEDLIARYGGEEFAVLLTDCTLEGGGPSSTDCARPPLTGRPVRRGSRPGTGAKRRRR